MTMHKHLVDTGRRYITSGMAKINCPARNRMFVLMYGNKRQREAAAKASPEGGLGGVPFNIVQSVIAKMQPSKISWAMTQIDNTIKGLEE